MYLRCPNNINSVFTTKCNQKYINIGTIKKDLIKLLKKLYLNESIRDKMKNELNLDLDKTLKNKDLIIYETNNKLSNLKSKQLELTNSFIDSIISKEVFEISSKKISNDIDDLNDILN